MYEYIVHCLKATYKYFALPPNVTSVALKKEPKGAKDAAEEALPDLRLLGIQPQHRNPTDAEENGPDDADCIIEEEEEVEEYSDSDEEREREKVDVGKNSISEDEEDEDGTRSRQHLDSFTTEEEIFPVDEISGEDLLSEEEAPDGDTSGSVEDEEEEEEEEVEEEVDDMELAPVHASSAPSEDSTKAATQADAAAPPKHKKVAYEFTKQAFTRGKVSFSFYFFFLLDQTEDVQMNMFGSPPVSRGSVQLVQARWPPEKRLPGRF